VKYSPLPAVFFNFLIQENYTEINPVLQIRQRNQYFSKQQIKRVVRKSPELQWGYVIETAYFMAKENPSHERTLFIMNALYAMYLRISELAASAQMLSENPIYTPPIKGVSLQDYLRAKEFLLSYQGSQDTFNAYRREIERFLQWCQLKANKSLTQIKREEFEAYLAFCQKPPKSWIAFKNEPRFILKNGLRIPNIKWRPFVFTLSKGDTKSGKEPDKQKYALSEKAFKALFAVISSFYNFLIQENYTMINPALLIRQKSRYLKKTTIKPAVPAILVIPPYYWV
jgi:site-specific recombinase XerD